MTMALRQEGQKTHRGEEDMKSEAETEKVHLQAKEHKGSPGITANEERDMGWILSETSEGTNPDETLISASKIVSE